MTGRPVETSRSACAKCGELLRPGDRFCPSCGSSVNGCERCGTSLGALDRFCPRCGASVVITAGSAVSGAAAPQAVEENPWALVVNRLRAATAGDFDILRELGRGGMAAVYLAHEVALNRKVAIKVMSPALLLGAGMVTRFRQEAITVANMSHPHIITIHAVRQVEDLHFFVMKFVEGRSLEHIIRSSGPLPIPMVRGLLWMVGNALAYAHRRGVVHRDVKPANILVDEDGSAVVTDFGIAKLVLGDRGVPRTSQGGQTQTGIIVGTPTYMSPEQCLARPVSAASDQYSLGLVAYELLTGRPPFTGSPFVVMHAHTERPAPSVRDLRPECDPELDQAVSRMLAKEPAQRWPSVQHALAALGAAPLGDADPSRIELARLSIPSDFRRSDEVLQSMSSPPAARLNGAPPPVAEPRPYVAAIEIFAPPAVVEVGDSFTLSGSPRNPSGDTMPGVRVRWSSSDERIATIDEARGLVQALLPGEVEISAVAGGIRNFVKVAIVPKRVAAINLSLPPGVVHVGDRVQLVARPEDKHHEGIAATVHWVSADEAIASVGNDGVVSAKAPGQVLVWAESQGIRGVARIEVTPAAVAALKVIRAPELLDVGESGELRAIAVDAAGDELSDRVVRWKSSDVAVVEVLNDRVAYARSAGLVRLTCGSEGKTASTMLKVVDAVVAGITISPPPPHVDLGLPITLHANVMSTRGVKIDRAVSWRSESPLTAAVDAHGVVLPLAPGAATVVARVDDVEERVSFEVNPAPELILPTDSMSATQRFELSEVRRMLGHVDPEADADADAQAAEGDAGMAVDAAEAGDGEAFLEADVASLAGASEAARFAVDGDDDVDTEESEMEFGAPSMIGQDSPSDVFGDDFDADDEADSGRFGDDRSAAREDDVESTDDDLSVASEGVSDRLDEEEDDRSAVVDADGSAVDDGAAVGGAGASHESWRASSQFDRDVEAQESLLDPSPDPLLVADRAPRRRLVMAGSGVAAVALIAWALWPTGPGPGDRQLATSSGAVAPADSASVTTQSASANSAAAAASDSAASANVTGTSRPDSLAVSPLRALRVGDSATVRARILGDTSGRGSVVAWSSSAPGVVRVNARTGRVTGVSEGTATITGKWGSATSRVAVRVLPSATVAQSGRGPQRLPVAELIATEVKSALRVGDTIRLTAAALDEHGKSILDRRASWRSERPEIATVDAWGLVTTHRVGKTDMVATLEQHSVRVPITVAARPIASAEVETALRARVDEFLAALGDRDADRLTKLYFVGSPQDQKNLDWLLDKVQRSEANLRVTRPQLRKPVVRDTEAVTELQVRLTWTQPSGRDRETNATFRARFIRDGEGWQVEGIRAARNLE